MKFTVVVVLLVLDELPVVALPPVVFPDTVAGPLEAVCVLTFVTVALLTVFMFNVFVLLEMIWFVESGPVLLIEPELVPPPALNAARAAAEDALLYATFVAALFMLLVAPVVAPPAVVLPVAAAGPDTADCPFVLVTPAVLLAVTVAVVVSTADTVFVELGPVPLIDPVCAAATPALIPTPITETANALSNFFISYSFPFRLWCSL